MQAPASYRRPYPISPCLPPPTLAPDKIRAGPWAQLIPKHDGGAAGLRLEYAFHPLGKQGSARAHIGQLAEEQLQWVGGWVGGQRTRDGIMRARLISRSEAACLRGEVPHLEVLPRPASPFIPWRPFRPGDFLHSPEAPMTHLAIPAIP